MGHFLAGDQVSPFRISTDVDTVDVPPVARGSAHGSELEVSYSRCAYPRRTVRALENTFMVSSRTLIATTLSLLVITTVGAQTSESDSLEQLLATDLPDSVRLRVQRSEERRVGKECRGQRAR